MPEDKNTQDKKEEVQTLPAQTPPESEISETPLEKEALPTSPEVEVDGGQVVESVQVEEPVKPEPVVEAEEIKSEPVLEVNLPAGGEESAPAPSKPPPPKGGQATIVGTSASHAIVKPILSFLDKLKELRGRANIVRHEHVEENLKKVMEFAREHNRIDNKDVRKLTGLSDERARYYLDKLEKEKKLIQFGQKGPGVFYKPTN